MNPLVALPRRLSLPALLGAALLLSVTAIGCGSSNPNISAAEDALDGQNYEEALRAVDREIEANPQNAEAYLLKGNVLNQQAQATQDPALRAERLGAMRGAYDQATEIDPGLQGQIDATVLETFYRERNLGVRSYNRADSLQDDRLYAEAGSYFEGAGRVAPDSTQMLVYAADSYVSGGDYEAAVAPLERAVEAGAADEGVYTMLGQLYRQQDRIEEAVTLLEEGTERYPENADLRSILLNAYQSTGDTERAMAAYDEAIAADPENATYRINYAAALLAEERYDEAIGQLERALEISPGNVNAQYSLGVAYRNKAAALTRRASDLNEQRRTEADQMSAQELQEMDQQVSALTEQAREVFRQAIEPLEAARQAIEQGNTDTNITAQDVCRPLFTAYVQTNQSDMAQQVEDCAGFEE